MPSIDSCLYLSLLDEAFDKKSWHGPNLRSSLRGVSARAAAWRPSPDLHNIWEYALHTAYWKYVVRRRITGEKRGAFVLQGSNFFARPVEITEAAWKPIPKSWSRPTRIYAMRWCTSTRPRPRSIT